MADDIQIDKRDFTFGKVGTTQRVILNETIADLNITSNPIENTSDTTTIKTNAYSFDLTGYNQDIRSVSFNITIENPNSNNIIISSFLKKDNESTQPSIIINTQETYSSIYCSIPCQIGDFIADSIHFNIQGAKYKIIITAANYKFLEESTADITYIPTTDVEYLKLSETQNINCNHDVFTKIFISSSESYYIDWSRQLVKWECINSYTSEPEKEEYTFDKLPDNTPISINNTTKIVTLNKTYANTEIITITHEKSNSPVFTNALMDLSKLYEEIAKLKENSRFYQLLYRVGDYYITENKTNPATIFGGTWTLVSERFLLGTSNIDNLGKEGGEKTHTLTIDEMPSHKHISPFAENYNTNWSSRWGNVGIGQGLGSNGGWDRDNWNAPYTSPVGGGQPHNNMPPYRYVYLWRKTSDEADPTNPDSFATPVTTLYKYANTPGDVGEIINFPENVGNSYISENWEYLLCNGQSILKSNYPELEAFVIAHEGSHIHIIGDYIILPNYLSTTYVYPYIKAKIIDASNNPRGITSFKTGLFEYSIESGIERPIRFNLNQITEESKLRNNDNIILPTGILNTQNNTQVAELNYTIDFYNETEFKGQNSFKLYLNFGEGYWKLTFNDSNHINNYNNDTTFRNYVRFGTHGIAVGLDNDLVFIDSTIPTLTNKVINTLPLGWVPANTNKAYINLELKSYFIKNFSI